MPQKSEWVSVSCSTERAKDAAKSWFCGMVDDMAGPSKARLLTRIDDGKPIKIKATFVDKSGKPVEVVRTFGQQFTVTFSPIN